MSTMCCEMGSWPLTMRVPSRRHGSDCTIVLVTRSIKCGHRLECAELASTARPGHCGARPGGSGTRPRCVTPSQPWHPVQPSLFGGEFLHGSTSGGTPL